MNRRGFTIIELIICIMIVCILMVLGTLCVMAIMWLYSHM